MTTVHHASASSLSSVDPLTIEDIRQLVDVAFTMPSAYRRPTVPSIQRRLLHALLSHRGLTQRQLIEHIWPDPDDEPQDPLNSVCVALHFLNPRLARYGYRVANAFAAYRKCAGFYRIEKI